MDEVGWQNAVGFYLSRRLVDHGDEESMMMMEAANWYALAAEQGVASAWGNIADLYGSGRVRPSILSSPCPPLRHIEVHQMGSCTCIGSLLFTCHGSQI